MAKIISMEAINEAIKKIDEILKANNIPGRCFNLSPRYPEKDWPFQDEVSIEFSIVVYEGTPKEFIFSYSVGGEEEHICWSDLETLRNEAYAKETGVYRVWMEEDDIYNTILTLWN